MREECVHEDLSTGIWYCKVHQVLCVDIRSNAEALGIPLTGDRQERAIIASAYITVQDERPELKIKTVAVQHRDGTHACYLGDDMEEYTKTLRKTL